MLAIIILLLGCDNSEQKEKEKDFLYKTQDLVLSENKVNQEYFFKIMLKNKVAEYSTIYLGNIINNQNLVYH